MTKQILNFKYPNEAWILHREEIDTKIDGSCNVYVLLDAYSQFIFGQEMSVDLPSESSINKLLQKAQSKAGTWPKQILISKKDPFIETFSEICKELDLPLIEMTAKELRPFKRNL